MGETAMFVLFCPIIEETNCMDNWMNFWFSEKPRSFWVDEIKSLLKKEYVAMRKKLNVAQVISKISGTWSLQGRVDLENFIEDIGQVIGVSMFYNLFHSHIEHRAMSNLTIFTLPAITNGFNPGLHPVEATTELITTLTAGPFSAYAANFNITDPENIAAI